MLCVVLLVLLEVVAHWTEVEKVEDDDVTIPFVIDDEMLWDEDDDVDDFRTLPQIIVNICVRAWRRGRSRMGANPKGHENGNITVIARSVVRGKGFVDGSNSQQSIYQIRSHMFIYKVSFTGRQ